MESITEITAIDYTYDPLDRLTRASYTGSSTSTFAYAYDAVGNRTVQTQTITSTLVTNYGYDDANRLTTVNGVAYTWDNNGNLLNDGAKSYGYDQANRLKQVTQGAITTTFAYNGVGDRLQQTVNGSPTRYVLDPAAGLTQVLSDGTNTYLYGNDRLAQYHAEWYFAEMQYFGADGLGSVRQIFDASAVVVGSSRYDPFGNVMSQGGATSVFGYTGEQRVSLRTGRLLVPGLRHNDVMAAKHGRPAPLSRKRGLLADGPARSCVFSLNQPRLGRIGTTRRETSKGSDAPHQARSAAMGNSVANRRRPFRC